MKRSSDRMLCSHIGSLPRTEAALEVLRARNEGEGVDDAVFEATVAGAVSEVVHRQARAGVTVINDGEQSKWAYMAYVRDRLDGFELLDRRATADETGLAAERADFPVFYERWPYNLGTMSLRQHACTGPIRYTRMEEVDRDIANLKAAAADVEVADLFMTAISPAMVWSTANEHYPDEESYRHAICDALAQEYARIVDAGIVVQIDSPDLGIFTRAAGSAASLDDYRRVAAMNIEGINYATRDIDPDMLRIHVCYGADEGPHHLDPNLADIADVFMTARPNGLTVVGANGRHEHEWKVWRDVDVPDGKVIMPGVIDSTSNIIEHPDLVADRIANYASVLGRENVIAGVDCGLDTIAGVYQVDPEIAFAKLASLGEGARRATERLY